MENPFNTTENTPKRSSLLTTFLVLTFIGSGASFISNAYISLFLETVVEYVEDLADDDAVAGMAAMLETSIANMEKVGAPYFGLLSLLALVSLTGAALMWRLNRHGFHLYASSQILLLFIPMVFGLVKLPGLFETLISALFIWLYARELKIFEKREA